MYEYTTQTYIVEYKDKKIYGMLFLPAGKKQVPLVILCHGFNGSFQDNMNYAIDFAHQGIGAYVFDFCGGSTYTKSSNTTREMSVLTQLQDVMEVFSQLKKEPFVDISNLFLFGESQGGLVAALAATLLKTDVTGLILLYPAFNIPDNARSEYDNIDMIAPYFGLWGVPLSKMYYEDIYRLDVYKTLKNYLGPVLILHGSHDEIVPISYSEKAVDVFHNAELFVADYVGHGFYGPQSKNASLRILQFIKKRMH